MPRCTDGKECFDDLCHFTEQTLCGIWVNEAEEAGDWGEEYEDGYDEPDNETAPGW